MRPFKIKKNRVEPLHRVDRGAETGFTLLEVILAISLLMVGLLAVASMQVSAINGNAQANRLSEATALAQNKLEELMSSVIDAATFTTLSGGSETADQYGAPYTITWTVDPNGSTGVAKTKVIEVEVSRDDLTQNVVLTSLIIDPDP